MKKVFFLFLILSTTLWADVNYVVTPTFPTMGLPRGPKGFPKGTFYTEVFGNHKVKENYILRIRIPPNYKMPIHTYAEPVHITVLEGVLNIGIGDRANPITASELPMGGYAMFPANTNVFYYTKDSHTLIQVNGEGPFKVSVTK